MTFVEKLNVRGSFDVVFISICICVQLIYSHIVFVIQKQSQRGVHVCVCQLFRVKKKEPIFPLHVAHVCTRCWIINSKIANQTLFP